MSWRCTTSSWGTIPIRERIEAYSACTSCPSNATTPALRGIVPPISLASVDLPAPDGPITAVSVPGSAP